MRDLPKNQIGGFMKLGEGTTPGPWHVGKPAPDLNMRCAIRDSDGWEIAEIPGLKPDIAHDKQDANARLIAKAPLLVECHDVLRDVLTDSSFEDGHAKVTMATLDNIRALLAKLES